ncbi:Predicted arabinose efflux permease, MFS family [Ectothiorhodospira mobilis]|uniref:Predicted arabinose efflux permease, MFS family n=1 Tax=Ectothiorhodospira mobilis TaxID=195064 RepID=A0A1I4QQ44_ECTMO|nr:MFS transporter [Ectothiorhodospira mobilis]SFM42157.1 Predicted arabinose efflux permease, MFS family [Ectothiorhodospira mobilis]
MTDYLRFVRRNGRFLFFGVLAAALSGYGQTFYVGVFGAELRAAFDLSHGHYGLLYSLATLGSGLLVAWAGGWIDRVSLSRFVTGVALGVAAGCLVMASATSAAALVLGLFLLRFCGQGLFMHTASTSMARHFETHRGKAVSIASKGLPLAEAVMPAAAVALIGLVGWRATWGLAAGAMVVVFLPLLLWLLRGRVHVDAADAAQAEGGGQEGSGRPRRRQWTRGEVLRDLRFYRILPVVLAPPFVMTAMVFHLAQLAADKGWSLEALAGAFTGFAAAHVLGLLVSGILLDRMGPRPMLRLFLLPMLAGLLLVATLDHPLLAWVFMSLMGLSIGGAGTLLGALWPVLYGTAHLGAIRAMAHAAMVLSTAITPVTAGLALDAGLDMERVALVLAGYIVVALGVSWGALGRDP